MKEYSVKKIEQMILRISFLMGLVFAVVELITSLLVNSNSMLMDAVYDFSELVIIALTIFLVPLFYKPLTEHHPFGYTQVESVFIVFKNLIMLSVTVGLLRDTIQVMLRGGNTVNTVFVAEFQIVLGCISVLVLIVMKKLNSRITSPIINTEIYGWKLDIYYSFGMSAAFFLATLLRDSALAPILPYFDQIVAIIIVICMIPQAVKMLITSLKNTFLFAPDESVFNTVKEITSEVLLPYGYRVVTNDMYRTGRILWVDVYVATDGEYLMMKEFSKANKELQKQLAMKLDNCKSQLMLYTDSDREIRESLQAE